MTEPNRRETKDKVILAGLQIIPQRVEETENSLTELSLLVETAGAETAEKVIQKRERPDPATFIGKGKAEEIRRLITAYKADYVVFDDELSPSQQRNLENLIDGKVMDRTALILQIFAQRAHSREGKVQVELAKLSYILPRLTGKGVMMTRIGGTGPRMGSGEAKLEVDRRRIRERISHLKKDIAHLKRVRDTQRKKRKREGVFLASLVGYTNAGKSTLMNRLGKANVLVEDKLFATLDSTTRKLYLGTGTNILISDTVGFIQKLPHTLVAAFRSTLDEVREADILLHVIDASHPYYEKQIAAVEETLEEIKAGEIPVIKVFNKADELALSDLQYFKKMTEREKNTVLISALDGFGVEDLKRMLRKACEVNS